MRSLLLLPLLLPSTTSLCPTHWQADGGCGECGEVSASCSGFTCEQWVYKTTAAGGDNDDYYYDLTSPADILADPSTWYDDDGACDCPCVAETTAPTPSPTQACPEFWTAGGLGCGACGEVPSSCSGSTCEEWVFKTTAAGGDNDDYYYDLTSPADIIADPSTWYDDDGACTCPCVAQTVSPTPAPTGAPTVSPTSAPTAECPEFWTGGVGCGLCGEVPASCSGSTCEEWVFKTTAAGGDNDDYYYDLTSPADILADPSTWYDDDGACTCPCNAQTNRPSPAPTTAGSSPPTLSAAPTLSPAPTMAPTSCHNLFEFTSRTTSANGWNDGILTITNSDGDTVQTLQGWAGTYTWTWNQAGYPAVCLFDDCYTATWTTLPSAETDAISWSLQSQDKVMNAAITIGNYPFTSAPVKIAMGAATCGSSAPEADIAAVLNAAVLADDGEMVAVSVSVDVTLVAPITIVKGVSLSLSGSASGRRLALDAPPAVMISGNNATTHFVTEFESTLTLSHLTLAYGVSHSYSGMGGGGGSISNHVGATVNVNGCMFLGNTAAKGYGGAIYTYSDGVVTITNSIFKDNYAEINGGAIYVAGSMTQTTLNVDGSRFVDNAAKGKGGAVFATSSAVTLTDVTLANGAAEVGGAIYSMESSIAATKTTFSGNTASKPNSAATDVSVGSAIFIQSGSLNANEITVSSNTATGGAAVHGYETVLDIAKSSFSDNVNSCGDGACGDEGEALYATASTVVIDETSFEGHSATNALHVLYFDSPTATTIDTCEFSSPNAAVIHVKSDGHVVVRNTATLQQSGVELTNAAIVADCSYATDDAIDIMCPADYCTNLVLPNLGVKCECVTYYGVQDPVKEGCENPPIVDIPITEFMGIAQKNADGMISLVQRIFLNNRGDDNLQWELKQTDSGPARYTINPPGAQSLAGSTMTYVTVSLSPENLEAHNFADSTFELLTNSVNPTSPLWGTSVVTDEVWGAGTVPLRVNSYITAMSVSDSTIEMGVRASDMAKEVVPIAGAHFFSIIKPVAVDGMWIKGSGSDLFKAKIKGEGMRVFTGDLQETICDVYYNSIVDHYEVDCLLRDRAAGEHKMNFYLRQEETELATMTVDVGCSDEFILDDVGHRCVCAAGSYYDDATGKCKVCPVGRFRDTLGASSVNDCWACERYLGGEAGASTKTTGSTSFDDCVCPAGFFSDFFEGNGRDTWVVEEENVGVCEECPLGGVCRMKNIELNVTFGVDKKDLYVLPGFWRHGLDSAWLYPCNDENHCVGSEGFDADFNASTALLEDTTVIWGDCRPWHDGPLCAVCAPGGYKGPDGFCEECTEGINPVTIYLPLFACCCLLLAVLGWAGKVAMAKKKASDEIMAKIKKEKAERRKAEGLEPEQSNNFKDILARGAGDVAFQAQTAGMAMAQSDALKSLKNLKNGVNVNTLEMVEDDVEDFLTSSFADPDNLETLQDGANQGDKIGGSVKVNVGVWGTISAMVPSLGLKFPPGAMKLLNLVGVVSMDVPALVPFACIYTFDYYDQVTVMVWWPVFVVAGLWGYSKKLGAAAAKMEDGEAKVSTMAKSNQFFKNMTYFLFIIYPSICKSVFNCFPCDEFETGEGTIRKLRADYRIDCDSSRYSNFVWFPYLCALLYAAGIPVLFVAIMYPHREYLREEHIKLTTKVGPDPDEDESVEEDLRLDQPEVKHVAFLIKQYKAKYWYFEAVECTRKVLITGVCSMLFQGKATQICISLSILAAYQTMYSYVQPFRTPDDNFNMLIGQVVTFAILFCGLMTATDIPALDSYPDDLFVVIIICLALIPAFLLLYIVTGEMALVNKTRQNIAAKVKKRKEALKGGARKMSRKMTGEKNVAVEEAAGAPAGGAGNKIHPGGE